MSTEQTLCDELTAFCDAHGLPHRGAEELMFINLETEPRNVRHLITRWLADFIGRWDAMQDEADRMRVAKHHANFEGTTLHLIDNPEVPALLVQMGHVQTEIDRLFFRMRPDVLGEDNHAAIEYERGCGRAIMNLLRAFAV